MNFRQILPSSKCSMHRSAKKSIYINLRHFGVNVFHMVNYWIFCISAES